MTRGRTALAAVLLSGVAVAVVFTGPAAANHTSELEVTVALNAAGQDRISVRDDKFDTTDYVRLASDVAIALDRPPGSFRASEDFEGGVIQPEAKLAQPDGRGGHSYALDTGKLQVLAQRQGYEAVVVVVCTPKVRQVVNSLVAPDRSLGDSPNSRCGAWYQPVDDPALRAVVQLLPDRQRYPTAVLRTVGAAAITFALLGLGATLLRRGPLRRRSLASWLLSVGAALGVAAVGWAVVTLLLWWRGAAADPMLLGGGSDGEQVVRTLLPGLAFVVPALLPAAVLLGAAKKEKKMPLPPPDSLAPPNPPGPTWWPTPWWQQWAAQGGAEPVPPPPPAPPPGGSGWAPPGAGGG